MHAAVPNPSPSASASRNADTDHRWLSTILKTSCANQRSVPRNADTLRLKESALRSWRAVETAGWQSAVAIIGVNSEGFPDSASRFDRNCRGKDAGKVGMQCATRIGQICAVVAVMRGVPFTGVVVAKLMMGRIGGVQNRLRAGARGRHDAGELRHHEQGDQQPHKPAYRPKPVHLRVDRSPPKTAAIVASSGGGVNRAGRERPCYVCVRTRDSVARPEARSSRGRPAGAPGSMQIRPRAARARYR